MDGDGLRRIALVTVALVLVIGPTAAAATPFAEGAQVDPDNVLLRVSIHADGSATWQVEYRVLLEDENTTEAFESLASDIEANSTEYTDRFAERMRRTVASAENATGREMDARNVSVRTTRTPFLGPDREYGVVIYSFEWTGFADADGDRIEAGDAVSGLFLDEQTRMIASWPAEYRLVRSEPEAHDLRDDAVVWNGRLDFASDEPRVVVTSAPPTSTSTAGEEPGTDTAPGTDEGSGLPGDLLVLVFLAVFGVLGAAGWLFVRRSGGTVRVDDPDEAGGGGPPEELLSNEERVLRLLEEHDGRMKQQQVAGELDWTDAKTSQVVGDLREEGAVDVFRLGRENVLSLPGEDEL